MTEIPYDTSRRLHRTFSELDRLAETILESSDTPAKSPGVLGAPELSVIESVSPGSTQLISGMSEMPPANDTSLVRALEPVTKALSHRVDELRGRLAEQETEKFERGAKDIATRLRAKHEDRGLSVFRVSVERRDFGKGWDFGGTIKAVMGPETREAQFSFSRGSRYSIDRQIEAIEGMAEALLAPPVATLAMLNAEALVFNEWREMWETQVPSALGGSPARFPFTVSELRNLTATVSELASELPTDELKSRFVARLDKQLFETEYAPGVEGGRLYAKNLDSAYQRVDDLEYVYSIHDPQTDWDRGGSRATVPSHMIERLQDFRRGLWNAAGVAHLRPGAAP